MAATSETGSANSTPPQNITILRTENPPPSLVTESAPPAFTYIPDSATIVTSGSRIQHSNHRSSWSRSFDSQGGTVTLLPPETFTPPSDPPQNRKHLTDKWIGDDEGPRYIAAASSSSESPKTKGMCQYCANAHWARDVDAFMAAKHAATPETNEDSDHYFPPWQL